MVQTHRPHADVSVGVADVFCGFFDVAKFNSTDFRGLAQGGIHDHAPVVGKALGVLIDEKLIGFVGFDQAPPNGVVEYHIGAGFDLQVQIGNGTGLGFTWIYHDDLDLGVLFFVLLQTAKQDGVAPGRVGASNHKTISQFNVGVADGYGIFTKGFAISSYRRTHTKAGIGVDVIGANESFDQFINQVILFSQALPRHVKGHAIRAVFLNDGCKNCGSPIHGRVPIGPFERVIAAPAHFGIQ